MIKVLVIDDDDAVREKALRCLARPDVQLASAANGELGLAQAKDLKPDLVICDVDMPGMDGFEVLEAVRDDDTLSATQVMMLTSHNSRDAMRLGMTLGADDYLTKPFTEDELRSAFSALMKKRGRLEEAIDHAVRDQEDYLRRVFGSSLDGDTLADSGDSLDPQIATVPAQSVMDAAVLFSDIRGFTAMSEKLTAAEVAQMLTEYFERVCEPVLRNDGHYLKMIGDGLMAVFTESPGNKLPAAHRALTAAVAMAEIVAGFGVWVRQTFPGRGLQHFSAGFGVHWGEVAISRMGSANDKEATPIGDTVNIAARLESASKQLGWTIVASRSVVQQAGAGVDIGRRDSITVRGKSIAVEVIEVLGVEDAAHFSTTVRLHTPHRDIQAEVRVNADMAARAVKGALDDRLAMIEKHAFGDGDGTMRLAGYTVLRRIGAGGMSTIYLATRESDGALVVLKILTASRQSQAQMARFVREYTLLSSIEHPNVVRIFSQGITEEHAYIAMEYFENGDLRSRMGRALPVERAVEIVSQVASALSVIHAQGIVHRDIKPENFMLRADDSIALADFGIAKTVKSHERSLTQHGELIGSPSYMSPEQVSSGPVSAASDLYSLGVVFYELLTGARPYKAENLVQLLHLQATAGVPAMPAEVAAFQPIVERLMAKRPEDRFPSADALLQALRPWR